MDTQLTKAANLILACWHWCQQLQEPTLLNGCKTVSQWYWGMYLTLPLSVFSRVTKPTVR